MLGIDHAIALTIVNRGWGLVAGPATLVFIANYLTPSEQGFYYAFTSVLGLQVFFELGLSFVIMQTVSHLMAKLKIVDAAVIGDDAARGRLGRLLTDALRWYSMVCAAFVVTVWIAGYWFLSRNASTPAVEWQAAWSITVPIFGLSILTSLCFSFLEGMGLVADAAAARLLQAIVGMLGLWLMLTFGFKLLGLAVLHALNLLVAATWLVARHRRLLGKLVRERAAGAALSWRREIWPFQWRIAASWTAGYMGSQAITLILFDRLGPVEAGRFGFTLTALGAVAGAATAWLSTKAPRFGKLVAQAEHDQLDALYAQAHRGAMTVAVLGALAVVTVVVAMALIPLSYAMRFVPLVALAAMATAMLVNVNVTAEASYLRAFRREPYLTLSVVSGMLQSVSAWMLSGIAGVQTIALVYSAIGASIGLLWARPLFLRLRQEYRAG